MQYKQLNSIRRGEFFRRKHDARATYVKGDYIRADKRFECQDWDDMNRFVYLNPKALVWIGFEF